MYTLTVDAPSRRYPICIGAEAQKAHEFVTGSQALLVTQPQVYELHGKKLHTAMGAKVAHLDVIELPEGEAHKNFASLQSIFDILLTKRHNRTTTLLALGGGVVGDITGFAAATYQRGVAYIQIPTTLLAQVDSSVGGKTAINHPLGKNMIGAFWQPQAVIMDFTTLRTLPKREFAAGMAEVIKYGLIADNDFLQWLALSETAHKMHQHDAEALAYAVRRSCEIKAQIVAEDEHDHGKRALLNFGHTFGHAIEAYHQYGQYVHGEAVAIGMYIATYVSCMLGHITQQEVRFVKQVLTLYNLPTIMPEKMQASDFVSLMERDKKTHNGHLRFILLHGFGKAYQEKTIDSAKITHYLREI